MKRLTTIVVILSAMLLFVPMVWGGVAEDSAKIDLNTATVEELATLKRVGKKYAERIVEYRQKNGLFKEPKEIMNVKGIGMKTYEENKDRLMVEKQQ